MLLDQTPKILMKKVLKETKVGFDSRKKIKNCSCGSFAQTAR